MNMNTNMNMKTNTNRNTNKNKDTGMNTDMDGHRQGHNDSTVITLKTGSGATSAMVSPENHLTAPHLNTFSILNGVALYRTEALC